MRCNCLRYKGDILERETESADHLQKLLKTEHELIRLKELIASKPNDVFAMYENAKEELTIALDNLQKEHELAMEYQVAA